MSSTIAWSYLFVTCKNAEQVKKVLTLFEQDKPGDIYFYLEQSRDKPLLLYFLLNDSEVCSDFDDIIINLDQWLKNNFDLSFEGYWWSEINCDEYRSEIHNGEIKDAYLGWLDSYTVEQIEQIRQYAETTFHPTHYN